jgi:protein SCO1/2
MNMKKINPILIFLCCYLLLTVITSADDKGQVGIDEKPGNYIPMDLNFCNSNGDTVMLRNIITKPTLIALVYYQCAGVCSPMQMELAWTVDNIQLSPGKDFKVISISFDHHETPEIATKWKRSYLQTIKRKFDPDNWLFLTGDSITIKKLTDACGFYFKPDEKQFIHASIVIAVSPQGKISRYLYGPDFNPFDVKMALLEAGSGESNPAITKALQYCFSFDPQGRKYTLNITRIIGAVMLGIVGIYLGVLLLKKKNPVKDGEA